MDQRTLIERDRQFVWHPYTQSGIFPEAIPIEKGKGALLYDFDGKAYIDAAASWWVNLHGHANGYINEKIKAQLDKLEQVIFSGFTHEPAVQLAERLIGLLPHYSKCFYTDNGSTAVEVAIKMAVQCCRQRQKKADKIVAIQHAYHGDTFGAMAVSERNVFTSPFESMLFEVIRIPFPEKGKEQVSLDALEKALQSGGVAAMIIEPLILGSGGMMIYEPWVLNAFFSMSKRFGVFSIADEVMTGFGRTGSLFAIQQVESQPDFICLSKGLTGGYLPMGVTLTTAEVHDAFVSTDLLKMLFHGHSFTANPLCCAAANASLDLLLTAECVEQRSLIAHAQRSFIDQLKMLDLAENPRSMGIISAFDVRVKDPGYTSDLRKKVYRFFLERGIMMRPMGNILYTLPPYCITRDQLQHVHDAIFDFLHSLNNE
jgi:adenosylmethionine-8-amino-7-oxononanoate aminotransferase